MANALRVTLLGNLNVDWGNVSWRPRSLKAQAIIAYLSICPNHSETREKLASLLWSESQDTDSRTSLRQVVSNIKKETNSLGVELLCSGRTEISLAPEFETSTDVQDLLLQLNNDNIPRLLIERKNPLNAYFTGLDGLDQAFSLFVSIERQALEEKISNRLSSIMEQPASSAMLISAAKSLLNLDQSNEAACRVMMHGLHANGDTAGALRAYSNLWDVLDEDFDIEPTIETQDLVVRIKKEDPTLLEQPIIGKQIPSVFKNDSLPPCILVHSIKGEGKSDANFLELHGFQQELISTLAKFRDWSIREYDGQQETAQVEKSEKIYDFILTSQTRGSQHFVALVLRRQIDMQHIWSEQYNIGERDWASHRNAVVRNIAQVLNIHMSEERLLQFASTDNMNVDLHDSWIKANNLLFGWNRADESQAAEILGNILVERPDFSAASAGLAQVLNTRHLIFPGIMRSREREQKALSLAGKAARQAPMDSRIQQTMAWSYMLNDRYDQAELHYELALRLNDIDPWTLCSTAQGLAYCGKHQKGIDLIENALRIGFGITPIHWAYCGCIQYLAGDYDRAVEAISWSDKEILFIQGILAASHAQRGECEKAKDVIQELVRKLAINWCGEESPTAEAMFAWLNNLFPIRNTDDRIHIKEGLIKTGMLEINVPVH